MKPARALAAALEPFVGQVYFAPECHRAYEALGFGGSPIVSVDLWLEGSYRSWKGWLI